MHGPLCCPAEEVMACVRTVLESRAGSLFGWYSGSGKGMSVLSASELNWTGKIELCRIRMCANLDSLCECWQWEKKMWLLCVSSFVLNITVVLVLRVWKVEIRSLQPFSHPWKCNRISFCYLKWTMVYEDKNNACWLNCILKNLAILSLQANLLSSWWFGIATYTDTYPCFFF